MPGRTLSSDAMLTCTGTLLPNHPLVLLWRLVVSTQDTLCYSAPALQSITVYYMSAYWSADDVWRHLWHFHSLATLCKNRKLISAKALQSGTSLLVDEFIKLKVLVHHRCSVHVWIWITEQPFKSKQALIVISSFINLTFFDDQKLSNLT